MKLERGGARASLYHSLYHNREVDESANSLISIHFASVCVYARKSRLRVQPLIRTNPALMRPFASVARIRRLLATTAGKQLGDISGIEGIAFIAELAVDLHLATMLLHQQLGIGLAQADQGATGALA